MTTLNEKSPAPEQASEAVHQRPAPKVDTCTADPAAETIVDVRVNCSNGTSSKVRSADALTDAIEQLNGLLDSCENGSKDERREARSAIHSFYRRALLAASPVEQPAAAPIDTPKCTCGMTMGHTRTCAAFDESMMHADPLAPAPADERAAKQDDLIGRLLHAGRHPDFAICMEAAKALREARASVNETGAEEVPLTMALNPNAPPLTMTLRPAQAAEPVAQWQYRIRTPGYDGDWHNCNPETAKRLQEQPYAEDHDVRALYAAPQPPAQADAREGLTDEQIDEIARRFAGLGGIEDYRAFARALFATYPGQPEPRAEVTDNGSAK